MLNKKNNITSLIIIIGLVIFTSGCSISFNTKGDGGNDGGIYLSVDKGRKWQQRVLIPTISGSPGSIGHLNTSAIALDPSDSKAVYFGSVDNGLFYAYDYAKEWQIAEGLDKATINDVDVDPSSKCIIYVATGNKVYKSTDCNRSWSQVYYDTDVNLSINSIAIDHYNSVNVYIGTSRGEVIKSLDRGVSWQTIGRFNDKIKEVSISPHDSRLIFAATVQKGIFRSTDSGVNWTSLEESLKDIKGAFNFRNLVLPVADSGLVILASDYGLLKSSDNGDHWESIELITPEDGAIINSVAVSPKNSKEIYYVTNTTFYSSLDGGENWTTIKLPTTRAGWKLLIDPDNTSIIYMGVRSIKN